MTRRAMIRVLLSLLLLVAQQMAFAHVISHWNSQRAAALAQDGGPSKAIAKDLGCDRCLAFAQIASAVGSGARSVAPPPQVGAAHPPIGERVVEARTACVFRSRAPPAA